jgi:sugar lactone lactonase YvrE
MSAILMLRTGAFVLAITLTACGGTGGPPPLSASGAGSNAAARLPMAGQNLYLTSRDDKSVLIFPPDIQGNKAPARRIAGSKTRLVDPLGLALDAGGNIYVADDGAKAVEIFPPDASGNATPKVLGGPSSGLVYVQGLAVDGSGQLYVADYDANAIFVFAKGASGDVAPIRTISGARTRVSAPSGVAFDPAGDLYVANGESVLEFAKNANGDVAPLMELSGDKTGIGYIVSVSIDPSGRIIVCNSGGSSVSIFARGASGNTAPIATISGPKTGLDSVTTTGVDGEGRIYATVLHQYRKSYVRVFANTANGDVAPIQTLAGPNTEINDAFFPTFH